MLIKSIENVPNAVYLYDFPTPSQEFSPKLRSVLLHSSPVLQVRWNPIRKGNLALCCGLRSIYTWSDEWLGDNDVEEEMAECIGVPTSKLISLALSTRLIRSQNNSKPEVSSGLQMGRESFFSIKGFSVVPSKSRKKPILNSRSLLLLVCLRSAC